MGYVEYPFDEEKAKGRTLRQHLNRHRKEDLIAWILAAMKGENKQGIPY